KRSAEHQVRHDPQARKKNPEPEKEHGQREPFDAAQVARHIRLRRRINRLEKSLAENPVVNNWPVDEPAETRRAVDLPAPFRRAGRPEKNQMLEAKKRFCLAVAFLLFAKRAQSETTVMPDDGRGTEGDLVSGLLDAPAKIDVVAGLVILGIEAADTFKDPAIPRHVAAGDVLGHGVGKEHMTRPAGSGRDTRLHPILRGRRNIRSPNARVIATQKRA